MKKYIAIILVLFLLIITPCVSADTGPKKSVTIEFENKTSENLYVTLLSEKPSTGPWSSIDFLNVDEDYYYNDVLSHIDRDIAEKFVNYDDEYYFLGFLVHLEDGNSFRWGYLPPRNFKLLIYDADTDIFRCSEVYSQYAFASYYKVDLANDTLILKNNYNYGIEILGLVVRILVTLAIEILVAGLFKLWHKEPLKVIVITNVITQIILNVLLNIEMYFYAFFVGTIILYVFAEMIVFTIEAIVYAKAFKDVKKGILYSLTANILSFVLGMILLFKLPF